MGYLFALLTAVCWALYNLMVRKGGDSIDAGAGYVLVLVLNVVCNLLMSAVLPHPAGGPTLWAVICFILAGMSTSLLGRFLFFQGVFTVGPSRSSAWKNAAPVYTLLLGAIFLHEGITWISASGVLVTLVGLAALAREQGKKEIDFTGAGTGTRLARLGLVFAWSSGVAFAIGFLLRKAGLIQWPDAAWGSAIGAAAALASWTPFALARGEVKRLLAARGSGLRFWVLAGLFSSLAQLTTFLSLRLLTTAIAQLIAALEPVFTILLSLWVLGQREGINRRLLLAVSVICAGVALVMPW